ncbi:hypothetical protein GCM10009738_87990 [Kitasatospora viridis]
MVGGLSRSLVVWGAVVARDVGGCPSIPVCDGARQVGATRCWVGRGCGSGGGGLPVAGPVVAGSPGCCYSQVT